LKNHLFERKLWRNISFIFLSNITISGY